MTVPAGYPEVYRLGFDMVLWFANIIISLGIALISFRKILKSDLINERELNYGVFLIFLGIGLTHGFFQSIPILHDFNH
ncbi:MAG: hypothetical protein ACTSR8_09450 [Promethearchaeota archaeon]